MVGDRLEPVVGLRLRSVGPPLGPRSGSPGQSVPAHPGLRAGIRLAGRFSSRRRCDEVAAEVGDAPWLADDAVRR